MPGEYPKDSSDIIRASNDVWLKYRYGYRFLPFNLLSHKAWCRHFAASTAFVGALFGSNCAHAENSVVGSGTSERLLNSMQSTDILMLAVFGGAMSFALMSASWLIRERKKVIDENRKLKTHLADLRANNDRNEALINIPEQRIVVWNGTDEKPAVVGTLTKASGAPENRASFLAFGKWLNSHSASLFENALIQLRTAATSFDLTLKSNGGGVIHAQGRVSGSHAFVRFVELDGERADHASLKADHAELVSTFETLQALFLKLPMPLWLTRKDGSLSWTNQAYATAVEASSPKDVVEKQIQLFDQEQWRTIQDEQKENGHFDGLCPVTISGDRKNVRAYSVKTDNAAAGIAQDKSDVEIIQAALKETVDSHSKMLDQLATAVAIFDKSQRLTFYNSGFQQLWKLEPSFLDSEPTNTEVLDAMRDQKLLPEHPDWRKWTDSQLAIYTALEPAEEWWHLLDGQTIRVVASPRNQGGVTWVFENVTEQLALESNYNALMQVQGETLDHLNEAVAVFGSNGKLKLFNPALEELWQSTDITIAEGLHVARVIEKWTDSISNEGDLENILGKVTGFDDERASLQGRLQLRDDSTLKYSLVPLPDGQTMLTFANVTASVNFEKALKDRAEALEESGHLKSKFIQHVSYELRAPLTTISGFGELLETAGIGKMNSKQAEYLSHINESAGQLCAIVDDILDLTSIDAGTMILDLVQVDFEKTVDEALQSLAPVMEAKKISTEIDIADKSRRMTGDGERLSQILHNLLSNAVNFSPYGGRISIQANVVSDYHEIRISDEGPGVAAEMKSSVFDRFEGRSPDGKRQGTGLGLSIVKSFIELQGGSIAVCESYERGACFVCRLPLDPENGMPGTTSNNSLSSVA